MRVFAGTTKRSNSQVHAFQGVNVAAGLSYKAFCGSTVFLSRGDVTCPWCRREVKRLEEAKGEVKS